MIHLLSIVLPVLINVAFFTLLERKILGLSQARKGPNKVSLWGMLQPFADALKLLSKQFFSPWSTNSWIFKSAPVLNLSLVLTGWSLLPLAGVSIFWQLSFFMLLVIMGLNLYPLLLAGWGSNSSYGLLGAMRGVAQTVSYEISLALLMLSYLTLISTLSIHEWFFSWQHFNSLLVLPLLVLWVIVSVAETNRTPFDFAEGESELVSGFNIEYGGFSFTLLFLAEYASILFLAFITSLFLCSQYSVKSTTILVMLGLSYFWVWLRVTLPRHRYDLLMMLAWTSLLPLTLSSILYFGALSV